MRTMWPALLASFGARMQQVWRRVRGWTNRRGLMLVAFCVVVAVSLVVGRWTFTYASGDWTKLILFSIMWQVLLVALLLSRRYPLDALLASTSVLVVIPWLQSTRDEIPFFWWQGLIKGPVPLLALVSIVGTAYAVGRRCSRTSAAAILVIVTLLLAASAWRTDEVVLWIILPAWLSAAVGGLVRRSQGGAKAIGTDWVVAVTIAPKSSPSADVIIDILDSADSRRVAVAMGVNPDTLIDTLRNTAKASIGKNAVMSREPAITSSRSWEGPLSAAPVAVTVLGLGLFVPIYLAYESFYRKVGIAPEEVGLGYATALIRETPWLIVALVVLLAAAVLIYFSTLIALGRSRMRSVWDRLGVVPVGPLRRAAALLAAVVVLATVNTIVQQVSSVADIDAGFPMTPSTTSFFRARATVTEITWIGDQKAPVTFPKRMLHLGKADGVSVFWDPAARRLIRIPTESIVVTTLATDAAYLDHVTDTGRVSLSSDASNEFEEFELAGIAPLPRKGGPGCSAEMRRAFISHFTLTRYKGNLLFGLLLIVAGPVRGEIYVLRLPDYAVLNAALLAAGAEPAQVGWYPTPSIKAEMTAAQTPRAQAKTPLPLSCSPSIP